MSRKRVLLRHIEGKTGHRSEFVFISCFFSICAIKGEADWRFLNKLFNGQIQLDFIYVDVPLMERRACTILHFWNRFLWMCVMSGCCREKPWNICCCSRTTENLVVYSELRLMELRWPTTDNTGKYHRSSIHRPRISAYGSFPAR